MDLKAKRLEEGRKVAQVQVPRERPRGFLVQVCDTPELQISTVPRGVFLVSEEHGVKA